MVVWGTEGHVRYADDRLAVFEDGVTYEGEIEDARATHDSIRAE